MTTFVLTSQLMLVPLVAAPNAPRPLVYVAELLASAMLAMAANLLVRQILTY